MILTSFPRSDASSFADVVGSLDEMGDDELVQRFRDLELLTRRTQAELAAITQQVERRASFGDDGHLSIAGWLRAQGNYAEGRVTQLRRCGRLVIEEPTVGEALHSGRVGIEQVAELGRARANPRCGDTLTDSLHLLLDHAQRLKFTEFRHVVKRWEVLADVDGAHRDRARNVENGRAFIVADADGVELVASGGTAMQGAELDAILEAFADLEFQRDLAETRERHGEDAPTSKLPRTDQQRRFDALLKIFRTANDSPGEGTPVEVTVNVIMDQYSFEHQLALHHLADEPLDLAVPGPSQAHCHTDRGVPLLPDDAVLAAMGGWVRRVVINSAGVVLDQGRRRRLFTGAAAEAVRLLVTVCDIPGCIVPEHHSQIDHLVEWTDDGQTDQDNGAIACGGHNRTKHRLKLRSRRDYLGKLHVQRPDGTWIVPVGTDPPDETDFLTDDEITQRIRDRLYRDAA